MRKLFTFIAALLVAFAANATDRYPDPLVSNSLGAATSAANSGDVIWLDDGTYVNVKGTDDYTKIVSKNITIKAIAGKNPVVKLEVPIRLASAGSVKFVGVKFDGASLTGYDRFFYPNDATDNSMEFENCEFTNMSKYIIQVPTNDPSNSKYYKFASIVIKNCNFHHNTNRGILNQATIGSIEIKDSEFKNFTGNYPIIDNYETGTIGNLTIEGTEFANNNYPVIHGGSGTHMDELSIDDCYFHNSNRGAVFFEAPGTAAAKCDAVSITNSTFANFVYDAGYYCSIIDIRNGGSQTDMGSVVVDHCTFYNNTTINSDHVCVRVHKSTNALVSNCIFMMPEATDRLATNLYGGYIKNCITYNYNHAYGANTYGHYNNGATLTNLTWADPLFTGATLGDFALLGMSPALFAGTDGSTIGDPRWASNLSDLYAIGAPADVEWNPTVGVEMDELDDNVFQYNVTILGTTYFAFVSDLAANNDEGGWAYVNGRRYGATSPNTLLADASNEDLLKGENNFKITEPGNYNIVANFNTMKVSVTRNPLVKLAGDFTIPNAWEDASSIVLEENGDGTCSAEVHLTPGLKGFKLIVDGTWVDDQNSGTMTRVACTGWDFHYNTGLSNSHLMVDVEGDYIFTYTYTGTLLSVTYPTTFTREATTTNYQTLCVPFDAMKPAGVAIYEVTNVTENSVTIGVPDIAYLVAGKSYIIKPETTGDIDIVKKDGGNSVAAPINTYMYGILGADYMPTAALGAYILKDNEFRPVTADNTATVNSTRAYLKATNASAAPALRIVMEGNEATDIQSIEAGEKAVKFIQNGQLYIQKDGITYTAAGVAVK